jgi:hypothetical protein
VPHLRRLAGEPAGVAVGDPDQLVWLGKWQRPQDERMDDAEDGGAGTDAKSRDQDGKSGKTGVPAQRANRVAEVLKQVSERHGLTLDGVAWAFV